MQSGSRTRLLLEARAPFELALMSGAIPSLLRGPRGDGHTVLVLPGLGAGDSSTIPLRSLLGARGYDARGWGQGVNMGPMGDVLDTLNERLRELHERSARRVSLVGWSLGGMYARALARAQSDAVRLVITLGTPLRDRDEPLPVPSTAIWSHSDGIVPWQRCVDRADEQHENVEVRSSHLGLGVRPSVLRVIADRLAQPEGAWRPYGRPQPAA